jgi:hypothetical protein
MSAKNTHTKTGKKTFSVFEEMDGYVFVRFVHPLKLKHKQQSI